MGAKKGDELRRRYKKIRAIKRIEKYFENVAIDFIGLESGEYEKRICAVVRTLLEIDEVLLLRELKQVEAIHQEAA